MRERDDGKVRAGDACASGEATQDDEYQLQPVLQFRNCGLNPSQGLSEEANIFGQKRGPDQHEIQAENHEPEPAGQQYPSRPRHGHAVFNGVQVRGLRVLP